MKRSKLLIILILCLFVFFIFTLSSGDLKYNNEEWRDLYGNTCKDYEEKGLCQAFGYQKPALPLGMEKDERPTALQACSACKNSASTFNQKVCDVTDASIWTFGSPSYDSQIDTSIMLKYDSKYNTLGTYGTTCKASTSCPNYSNIPGTPSLDNTFNMVKGGGKCRNDCDCALAGECVNNKCVCESWSQGLHCTFMNLLPSPQEDGIPTTGTLYSFYNSDSTNFTEPSSSNVSLPQGTWSGALTRNYRDPNDDNWYLIFQMLQGNSLSKSWGKTDYPAIGVSKDPKGPFKLLLTNPLTGENYGTPETNPGQILPGVRADSVVVYYNNDESIWYMYGECGKVDSGIWVATSNDLFTWKLADNLLDCTSSGNNSDGCKNGNICLYPKVNNPALYQFSKGEAKPITLKAETNMLGYFRNSTTPKTGPSQGGGETITGVECPNGKECDLSTAQHIMVGTSEDPGIFRDKKGNFHLITNVTPYKCSKKCLGHLWSQDGLTWSPVQIGSVPLGIELDNGTVFQNNIRREQPKIYAENGIPLFLANAKYNANSGHSNSSTVVSEFA